MTSHRWAIGAAFAGILAFGCANGNGRDATAEPTMPETAGTEMMGKAGTPGEVGRLSQADLIGIASTLNEAEVEAAAHAQQMVTQPEVREVAATIERDHARALEQEAQLARQLGVRPTRTSPMIDRLQQQHQQAMMEMHGATDQDIGLTYVTSQIRLHQEADRMLEQQLIPAAEGMPELSQHLRGLQQTVQRHERQLRDVQSRLEAVARQ